jgi:hypothetical protein
MNEESLAKFQTLVEEEIKKGGVGKRKKMLQLMGAKKEIQFARDKGVSFLRIAKLLKLADIAVSDFTVRAFCISELGEEPKKARGRRRKKGEGLPKQSLAEKRGFAKVDDRESANQKWVENRKRFLEDEDL